MFKDKFGLRQEVYYEKNKEICTGYIIGIDHYIRLEEEPQTVYYVVLEPSAHIGTAKRFTEDKLYSDKNDLKEIFINKILRS